jgi:hypothetical protein
MIDSVDTDTVLLLASHEYINVGAVLRAIQFIPMSTTIQIASHRTGIGNVISKRRPAQNISTVKWQPTRPTQQCTATRALLFWDGRADNAILRSLVTLKRLHIPVQIIDLDGNPLDLPTFCARLKSNDRNGDHQMSSSHPNAALAPSPKPSVIVDPPSTATEGAPSKNKVRLQIHIPESTIEQYELQARAAGQSLEKVCSDRLRTCINHTSGRGLYFNDDERSKLEHITGGHLINDAAMALMRVKTTVELKVGGITIELTDRVLQRCASRAKSTRKSLEEFVRKEVIEGLERSSGLRPW